MWDNNNIISASVSEDFEKIPADEKDYRNGRLSVLFCAVTAYKQYSCLPTRIHPV